MGIFDSQVDLFTDYRARIKFRDLIMGGIPKRGGIVEGWLRAKAGLTDDVEELRAATIRTLLELYPDRFNESMSYEEIVDASEQMAGTMNTNGFKQDQNGLYLESRAVKAMLKENVNIRYASERWGKTKKGPKAFFAEHVFINPDHISLGVLEPSGTQLFIGHTSGPQGRQSNLTYHEYVREPEITFTVRVAEDAVTPDQWANIWVLAQENGLGALRSQGFGRFDIEGWDRI